MKVSKKKPKKQMTLKELVKDGRNTLENVDKKIAYLLKIKDITQIKEGLRELRWML